MINAGSGDKNGVPGGRVHLARANTGFVHRARKMCPGDRKIVPDGARPSGTHVSHCGSAGLSLAMSRGQTPRATWMRPSGTGVVSRDMAVHPARDFCPETKYLVMSRDTQIRNARRFNGFQRARWTVFGAWSIDLIHDTRVWPSGCGTAVRHLFLPSRFRCRFGLRPVRSGRPPRPSAGRASGSLRFDRMGWIFKSPSKGPRGLRSGLVGHGGSGFRTEWRNRCIGGQRDGCSNVGINGRLA